MSLDTVEPTRFRLEKIRDDTAKQVLVMAEAIGKASGRSHGRALFAPPTLLSIREAATATTLDEKLTRIGYRCAWRERREHGNVLTHDLAVSGRPRRSAADDRHRR